MLQRAVMRSIGARRGSLSTARPRLTRLSHSVWRAELLAALWVEQLSPGVRGGGRDCGLVRLGIFPVLLLGGQIGRSQAAASRSRVLAAAKTSRNGQAEARANLTWRTLTVTCAPILSSLRRMLPQDAFASSVPASAMRRSALTSTCRVIPMESRSLAKHRFAVGTSARDSAPTIFRLKK